MRPHVDTLVMTRAQALKHFAKGVMVHSVATFYVLIVNCKLVGLFYGSDKGTDDLHFSIFYHF